MKDTGKRIFLFVLALMLAMPATYSATVLDDAVDFVKLAKAMGAEGVRVETRKEFDAALERALSLGKPIVIDCQIDPDDKVWPMVAPGAAISEAFDEKDLESGAQG